MIIIAIMLELLSFSLVACSLSFSINCSIGTLHCSSLYDIKAVLDFIIFAIAVACEFASIASLCIGYFLLGCIAFILDFFGSCCAQKSTKHQRAFWFQSTSYPRTKQMFNTLGKHRTSNKSKKMSHKTFSWK